MGFAEQVNIPVIIVSDIDRGGVFAHLFGTLELLSETEKERVKGFVINKFRGDIRLLQSGIDWLESKTGKPVLGVLPFLHGLDLEAEDAINSKQVRHDGSDHVLRVGIPVFTRMSNHTDFDAMRLNPSFDVTYVGKGQRLVGFDLIVLPGTKSTRSDLYYLRSQGWDGDIQRHLRFGGKVIGICGGFQMLGMVVDDPNGIEGPQGWSEGLKLLPTATVITEEKALTRVRGSLRLPIENEPTGDVEVKQVVGYEIHAGRTTVCDRETRTPNVRGFECVDVRPLVVFEPNDDAEGDAQIATDGLLDITSNQIFGTYIHGFFDTPSCLEAVAKWGGLEGRITHHDHELAKEKAIDMLADCVEAHMKLDQLWPNIFTK
eukprot:PhM_4_TR7781/c0_g1_i1/m.42803/K02232/cobQ, cbiP; adenosylcobyric acid synthase